MEQGNTIQSEGMNLEWSKLVDSGLLWAINRTIFHPMGYGMGVALDDDGSAVGWQLLGDGTEPWGYEEEIDQLGFSKWQAFVGPMASEWTATHESG